MLLCYLFFRFAFTMFHARGKGVPSDVYSKRSELSESDIFQFWKKHNIPHYPTVITEANVKSAAASGHLDGRHALYYTKYNHPSGEKQRTEHWCCLSMAGKRLAFFDPYGQNPLANGSYETPLARLIGEEEEEYTLLTSSDDDDGESDNGGEDKGRGRRRRGKQHRYSVFFSHGDCQAPGTNVCGEYCALFGMNGFNLKTFYDAYQLEPFDTLTGQNLPLTAWAPASINNPTKLGGNANGATRNQQLGNDQKILALYANLS